MLPQQNQQKQQKLGKLKRTLRELCPDCEEINLQLRSDEINILVKGEERFENKDYKYCPKCGYKDYNIKGRKKNHRIVLEDDE